MVKLEFGKKYRRADGMVYEIIAAEKTELGPKFKASSNTDSTFNFHNEDGTIFGATTTKKYNLIAEIKTKVVTGWMNVYRNGDFETGYKGQHIYLTEYGALASKAVGYVTTVKIEFEVEE